MFPTKKEGKYIVKLRESKPISESRSKERKRSNEVLRQSLSKELDQTCSLDHFEQSSQAKPLRSPTELDRYRVKEKSDDLDIEDTNNYENIKNNSSIPIVNRQRKPLQEQNKSYSSNTVKPLRTKFSGKAFLKSVSDTGPCCTDSTINLEILEQLRNLGEEIRNDRFKKEQKQYIKHVVNKELNKSRIRSKYVPDIIPQENEYDVPKSVDPLKSVSTLPENSARTRSPTKLDRCDSCEVPSERSLLQEPIYQPELETPIFRSRIRR